MGTRAQGLVDMGEYGLHGELRDHVALLGVQGPGDRDIRVVGGRRLGARRKGQEELQDTDLGPMLP